MRYIHSLLQVKFSEPLECSRVKQRILAVMGTFISVNWNAYRLLAHTHNSWTHFPFLKATQDQSVFGHPLFERVLVCGKKGKEKIRDWWLPVGNSCQDRKTSVCEGKRRRKPHNQDLFCGLWLGQSISGTGFNYTKIWMYS